MAWSASDARTATVGRLGNSAGETRIPPVTAKTACMRPCVVDGWKAIWSSRNPVTAAAAARSRSAFVPSRSTAPQRARVIASRCAASSASTAADSGPKAAKSR